jgi:uncharacterized RDD family membrane protein YckC
LDVLTGVVLVGVAAVAVSASEAAGPGGGGGRPGPGRRAAARAIDDAIAVAVWAPLGGMAVLATAMTPWAQDEGAARRMALGLAAAGCAVAVGYEAAAGRAGAGLGKLACGIRVVDRASGNRLSLGRSLARGMLVAGPHPVIVAGLGLVLWGTSTDTTPFVTAVSASLAWRGLLAVGAHDRIVGSRVVRTASERTPGRRV